MTTTDSQHVNHDLPLEARGPATCPFCHTTNVSMTQEALDSGAYWRCARCSQRWDAGRLATAAAYALWAAAHDERQPARLPSHGR